MLLNVKKECSGDDCVLPNDELLYEIDNSSLYFIDDEVVSYISPLGDDEILSFINSSNSSYSGVSFLGSLFNYEVSTDYMIYFSLYRLLNNASKFTDLDGTFYIKKSTLEDSVNAIFGNIKIDNNYNMVYLYLI